MSGDQLEDPNITPTGFQEKYWIIGQIVCDKGGQNGSHLITRAFPGPTHFHHLGRFKVRGFIPLCPSGCLKPCPL